MSLPWVQVQCKHPDCEEWFDTLVVWRWRSGQRVQVPQHDRCAGHRRGKR